LHEIWSTLEYIIGGWLRQILGEIRALATAGEPREILFLSGKQSLLPVSQI